MSKVDPSATVKTEDIYQAESADYKTSNCETSVANREIPKVKFVSADGKSFTVEEKVARKFMFSDTEITCAMKADEPIHLKEINASILTIMIKWAVRHVNDPEVDSDDDNDYPKRTDDIDEWDNELLSLDPQTLFSLVLAAKSMQMKNLLTVSLKKSANLFKGKTPEEIRKTFGIERNGTVGKEGGQRKVRDCIQSWFCF